MEDCFGRSCTQRVHEKGKRAGVRTRTWELDRCRVRWLAEEVAPGELEHVAGDLADHRHRLVEEVGEQEGGAHGW